MLQFYNLLGVDKLHVYVNSSVSAKNDFAAPLPAPA
jgi:hypothetical protein